MTASETEYRLTAELPGLSDEDVTLSVTEGVLSLTGEKRSQQQEQQGSRLLSERSYGSFERRLKLPPDVDVEKIGADFHQGVLTVTLPRTKEIADRTHNIAIQRKD